MKININKLSRAEQLKLYDIIQEKKRRDRLKKPPFVPFEAQLPIIKSKALEKYLFSGNGFSKTTLLVNWIHWAATGYNTVTKERSSVPSIIYLVVDDPGKIEQKIIPEYRKWQDLPEENIHKDGKPHPSRFSYPNGSVVYILTHDVNMLKLEGVEMTHLAFDEPPPRHVFQGLYRGGRIEGKPLQVFLAGTPLYQAWLRTDVYEKWVDGLFPDGLVECFFGTSSDNPHLPDNYETRYGMYLSEEEKATRFKGHFFDASGQALAQLYDPKKHELPVDLTWNQYNPCVVAIDPHSSKPHHAVLMGVDRDNRYTVLDEWKSKKIARQFIRELIDRKWFSDFRVIDIVYDSSGNADMTSGEGYKQFGTVVNEELQAIGYHARGTSYDEKDDEVFIEKIREVLHVPKDPDNFGHFVPKLRFRSSCRGCIRDVKQVQWQRDRKTGTNKTKLDISNRDYLACMKYALASNLFYSKPLIQSVTQGRRIYGM